MRYNEVWISSVKHLNQFKEISDKANFFQKVIGNYNIPEEFPYVKLTLFKVPIVFFSKGELELDNDKINFITDGSDKFLRKYKNIKRADFSLSTKEIKSLERYQPPAVVAKYFTVNWIRIKSKKELFGGDFLICVGGNGPSMNKIQKDTDNLFNLLNNCIK